MNGPMQAYPFLRSIEGHSILHRTRVNLILRSVTSSANMAREYRQWHSREPGAAIGDSVNASRHVHFSSHHRTVKRLPSAKVGRVPNHAGPTVGAVSYKMSMLDSWKENGKSVYFNKRTAVPEALCCSHKYLGVGSGAVSGSPLGSTSSEVIPRYRAR